MLNIFYILFSQLYKILLCISVLEIGRTKQILIDTFCKLKYETLNAGLIVNDNKTKYLFCTWKTIQPAYINTGEEQIEQVNSFKYLEQWWILTAAIEEEIKEK